RKGAITLFLHLHHYDIFEFIRIVEKSGDKYERAHDINTAIKAQWVFWKRVSSDGNWTLFCPAKTDELNELWGEKFESRYIQYEREARGRQNHYMALKEKLESMKK